jgi:hypothetical protein
MWPNGKLVSVRLDIVLILTQDRCTICGFYRKKVPLAQKSFLTQPMVLLGDVAQLKSYFGLFGDSANLNAR